MSLMRILLLLVVGIALGAMGVWFAAPSPTADLERRIATAEKPADHEAIAPILLTKAQEYERAAAFHRELAAKYAKLPAAPSEAGKESPASRYADMATHCLSIAEGLKKAAGATRALATGHEWLAVGGAAARREHEKE